MSDPALTEISKQIVGNQVIQQSLFGQLYQIVAISEQTAIKQIEEKAQQKSQGGFPGSHLDQNKYQAELKEYSETTILNYFSTSQSSHIIIDCGQGELEAAERLVKIMKLQNIVKSSTLTNGPTASNTNAKTAPNSEDPVKKQPQQQQQQQPQAVQNTNSSVISNSSSNNDNIQTPVVIASPNEYYYNILPFIMSGCKIVLLEKLENGQVNEQSLQKKLTEVKNFNIQIVLISAIHYMKIMQKMLAVIKQHKDQVVTKDKKTVYTVVDISKFSAFQKTDLNANGFEVIDYALLQTQKVLGGFDAANCVVAKLSTYKINTSQSLPPEAQQTKSNNNNNDQQQQQQFVYQDPFNNKANPFALYKTALCLEYLKGLPKDKILAKHVENMKLFLQNVNNVNQEINKEASTQKKNILVNVVDDPLSIQLRFYGPGSDKDSEQKPMFNTNLMASMLNDFYGIKVVSNYQFKSKNSVSLTNIPSKQIAEQIVQAQLPDYQNYQQGWVLLDLFFILEDADIVYIFDAFKQIMQSAEQVQTLYELNSKTGLYQLKNSPSVANLFSLNYKNKIQSKQVEDADKGKTLMKQSQKISLILSDPLNQVPKLIESNNIKKLSDQQQDNQQQSQQQQSQQQIISSNQLPDNKSVSNQNTERSPNNSKQKLQINLSKVPSSIDEEENYQQQQQLPKFQRQQQQRLNSKIENSPANTILKQKVRKSQYQDFNDSDLRVMTNILELTRAKVQLNDNNQQQTNLGSQRSLSSYIDSKLLQEIDQSPTQSPNSRFQRGQLKRMPSKIFNNSIDNPQQRNKYLQEIFKVYQENQYMDLIKFWNFAEDFNINDDLISKASLRKICQDCSPISRGMQFGNFMMALDKIAQIVYSDNKKYITQTEKLAALYQFMNLDNPSKIINHLNEISKTRNVEQIKLHQLELEKDKQLQENLEKLQNKFTIKYKKNNNSQETGKNSLLSMQSNMSDIQQELRYLKQSQLQDENPIQQYQKSKRIQELEQQHETIIQDLKKKQQQEYQIKQELYQQYLNKVQLQEEKLNNSSNKHKPSYSVVISRHIEKENNNNNNNNKKNNLVQLTQNSQTELPNKPVPSLKKLHQKDQQQEKKYYNLHKYQSLKRLNMKNQVDWQTLENASMQDYTAAIREQNFTPSMLINEKDKDEYLQEYDLEIEKKRAVQIQEDKQKQLEEYGTVKKRPRVNKEKHLEGSQSDSHRFLQDFDKNKALFGKKDDDNSIFSKQIAQNNQQMLLQQSSQPNVVILPKIHLKRKIEN